MTIKRSTNTTAGLIARRVRRAHNKFFRRLDFVGSRASVEKALSRLVEDGELIRVRNGLYWRGTKTPLGMSPPNPREVVRALAGNRGAGPAGLSAASLLGLTSQIPRIPVYAVPASISNVDRIHLVRREGTRGAARRAANLTESDVAFLEVLDAWNDVVELPAKEAVGHLRDALSEGELAVDSIVRVAAHEPARSRVRLRALLEVAGRADLADRVPGASTRAVENRALKPLRAALA